MRSSESSKANCALPADAVEAAADGSARDADIAKTMFALLDARAARATICPSDVARGLMPNDESAWRALMPEVRRIAAGLGDAGRVRVTRNGELVDASVPGGPIRIGRPL